MCSPVDERIQWALLFTYVVQLTHLLKHDVERLSVEEWLQGDLMNLMYIVALFGFLLAFTLMRNLRGRLVSQHNAVEHLESIHARLRTVVLVQLGCFFFVVATALSSPLLVHPIAFSEANPCHAVSQWYLATRCGQSHTVAGATLICSDGGFERYASAYAACVAARSQLPMLACTYSAIMISLNALLFLLLLTVTDDAPPPPAMPPIEWKGVEPFWLSAWLFATISIGCCPLYLAVVVVARSDGLEHMASPWLFAALSGLRVQVVNLVCWAFGLLLFNTQNFRTLYQTREVVRCLGCTYELAGSLHDLIRGTQKIGVASKFCEPNTFTLDRLSKAARD